MSSETSPPPPPPMIGLFEDNAVPLNVSLKRQIACVKRQLKQTFAVYLGFMSAGRTGPAEEARTEIGELQAVLRTLLQVQLNAYDAHPGDAT